MFAVTETWLNDENGDVLLHDTRASIYSAIHSPKKLASLLDSCGLVQHIREATHRSGHTLGIFCLILSTILSLTFEYLIQLVITMPCIGK